MPIIKHISETQHKTGMPDFQTGYVVKVHQKIKEGDKERIQLFEGMVIARKGGNGANATFTVRKISNGVGVERIYPLHSPNVAKIEVIKENKVRRAKLYYVRSRQDGTPRMRKTAKVKKAVPAQAK